MKYNISDLGPVTRPTPDQIAAVRAFVAGQPDADVLLDAMGAGEWDE